MKRRCLAALCAAAAWAGVPAGEPAWLQSPAAIVDAVEPGWPAERAGVRAGDRIAALHGASGPALDRVLALDADRSKLAATPLVVHRDGHDVPLQLPPGERGWKLRPDWTPEAAAHVRALLGAVPHAPGEAAVLVERLERDGAAGAAAWLCLELAARSDDPAAPVAADALARLAALGERHGRLDWSVRAAVGRAAVRATHGDAAAAEELLRAALASAEGAGDELAQARVLAAWSDVAQQRGALDRAVELAERARSIHLRLAPDSLLVADSLQQLAQLAWWRGSLAGFAELARRAHAIRERLAPDSLDLAASITQLAEHEWARGHVATALAGHREALARRERLAPGSLAAANSYNNLGRTLFAQGEWLDARDWMLKALPIQERRAPGSLTLAWTYNNLGVVSNMLGDFQAARRNQLRALAIRERVAPESNSVAYSLMNLSELLIACGDVEGAREHASRALAIIERVSRDSPDVALCHHVLGEVEELSGRPVEAAAHHRRALEIRTREMPDGAHTIDSHVALGQLALQAGDLAEARRQLVAARDLQRALAAGSSDMAWILDALGVLALREGRLDEAARLQGEALGLLETRLPHNPLRAEVVNHLGDLARARGDLQGARERYAQAVAGVSEARLHVGGQLARATFAGRTAALHHDLVAAAVALGDREAAWAALERGRARGLIELMAERRASWPELPPDLRRRVEELRLVLQRTASPPAPAAGAAGAEALAAWRSELVRLRSEEDALVQELRETAPQYATLAYPQPLDFDGIRRTLPAGTALIAFSTGAEETVVLGLLERAGAPPALTGATLPLGARELARRVDLLRGLLSATAARGSSAAWRPAAEALGATLLGPAGELLASATRVLIVPDGPLHELPFGVLCTPGPGGPQPLAARLAVHVTGSLTLYGQLRQAARPRPGPAWVGIGSPRPELPGALEELAGIERLIRARSSAATRLHVRDGATEACARGLPPGTSMIHFACHGVADDRFPMHSALVLAAPAPGDRFGDDGLFQAWEIFQDLRLDTDLVVLSGCETGRGQAHGGEGLLGLSRAFLFAGARSLLVSLWPVSDSSTALLMQRFYRGLLDGLDKDEALVRAQRELMHHSRFAHPYHWAAFVLNGDPGLAVEPSGAPASRAAWRVALPLLGLGLLGWRLGWGRRA